MADGISAGSGSGRGGTLDVAQFLKALPFTRFHVRLLLICSLVTFFDGLDFSLISFTMPDLARAMDLSKEQIGNVGAMGNAGQMIGSLIGSYIADVVGRRPVVLWCTFLSAILTFVTGFAENYDSLLALRFVGGMAIGGLLAPAWAVNIESMPAGKKATAVTIIMLGFSAGGAMAGQVTNWLAPDYGWEGVFFFAGATTLLLAFVLLFAMPESVRWLAAKGRAASRIEPLVRKFDPTIAAGTYTGYTLSDERKVDRESPWAKFAELFRGTLGWITPIIWFTYFFSSFAIYLKSNLGTLFLVELGLTDAAARNLGSITGITGAVAGVLVLWFTEKRGPAWIAIVPLLGIPATLIIGWDMAQGSLFTPMILIGGILIGAGHAAVISLTSIYYPSAVRSTGGGWASFMAKFAAVAAPFFGARWFLGSRAAVLDGYLFTGLCLAGVVLGLFALGHYARRLKAEEAAEAEALALAPQPAGA
jgi:AAHS family 4-hydroxybenzoate transporter-like MFS transporter